MQFYIKLLYGVLQLNNLELAVNLAKRGNLPGAENLVTGCWFWLLIHTDFPQHNCIF